MNKQQKAEMITAQQTQNDKLNEKEDAEITQRANIDEIGENFASGDEINTAIEQQGDDAAAGIPRDTDAAKHEQGDSNERKQ